MNRKNIIAYNFNQDKKTLKEMSRKNFNEHCVNEFVFSTDQESLFIFSCPKIYKINTKTVLANF